MVEDNGSADSAAAGNNQEDSNQPTAPVRGKMISNDDLSDWGNEATFAEPEVKTGQNALRDEIEGASNKDNKTEEDEEAKKTAAEGNEEDTDQEEEDEPAASTGIQIPEDPGEFQPADYSFEVTIYDKDGNKPKTVKVGSIDEWEKLLEDEPNLGSSVAVNRAFRAAQKMEDGQERDFKDWETKVKKYNEEVEKVNQSQARNDNIFNEMNYLMDKGDLPKLTREEMNNLDWNDAAVQQAHPNIKAHQELLSYMVKENRARAKAGIAPLSSVVDAFNAMQLDGRRKADVEAKRSAGEARKAAGARVASGSSTPISAAAPRGIAVGRTNVFGNLSNWSI